MTDDAARCKASGAHIGAALASISGRIAAAAARAGRDPSSVTLIGVTKTVDPQRVRAAVDAGLQHLGENRVQEAEGKQRALGELPGVRWHLIGHLQSNKAAHAAEMFDCVHSVDSLDLGRRLDRAASRRTTPLQILVQVDLGHEPTKHGVDERALEALVSELSRCGHIEVRGLMTIPPLAEDPETSRPFFRHLVGLRDRLAASGHPLPELSMGMTGDFEVAVEEGATLVRVGRALFGERPPVR
ncbi:MAG: YggS family pyridoxal phosphate-dependent enzyme [Candidatus Polarisedimenticolia bacterium]